MMRTAIVRAPRILFGVAVLMLVLGALGAIVSLTDTESFGEAGWRRSVFVFQSLYQTLSGAVWPFFGAALLWRVDMGWFKGDASSEAAE